MESKNFEEAEIVKEKTKGRFKRRIGRILLGIGILAIDGRVARAINKGFKAKKKAETVPTEVKAKIINLLLESGFIDNKSDIDKMKVSDSDGNVIIKTKTDYKSTAQPGDPIITFTIEELKKYIDVDNTYQYDPTSNNLSEINSDDSEE